MSDKKAFKGQLSIVLAGEAGQGIKTIESVLINLFKTTGYHVFSTKEYMSRVRGGCNSTEIRVASFPISCFADNIDIFFALNKQAFSRLKSRISNKTMIIADKENIQADQNVIDVPFKKIADEIGNPVYANMVAVGWIAGILNITEKKLKGFIEHTWENKSPEIIANNILAAEKGRKLGLKQIKENSWDISIGTNLKIKEHTLMNGTQAVSLGAIAGGCNFVSSYPMSPSTGMLTFLAKHSQEFGIIVEQAEDEISAINMGLGSWYAGGRALATTSGGGFALMSEGISLAGCIESPMVIHLAQRPGPATGLPTRTEQGDLELALYSGHGEFPRVILTPGNIKDAFLCGYEAFRIADKYQVPVIILTDQLLLDSYHDLADFPQAPDKSNNQIIKTTSKYKRYQLSKNGVSERGIPGYGKGLVCVDSDEHDEAGYITEDFDVRIAMVDKRLKKADLLKKEILEPEFFGVKNYEKLIIGFGSTCNAVKEAIQLKTKGKIGFLYFKQVYPLSENIKKYWKKAKEVIVIENNATGQFEKLIRREFGLSANRNIRKYNGLPFSVEEIINKL